MLHLFMISQPMVNWDTLIQTATNTLGRSPTETLDHRRIGFKKKLPDFLSILKEITLPKSDPLNNAGHLLEHMHFVFGVVTTRTTTLEILTHSRLAVSTTIAKNPDFYFTVISGTLNQWQTAIINCCVEGVSTEVRSFGTQVLNFLETQGLKSFMSPMTKVSMSDGTVRLIEAR
jgi:hypothetical protein